MSGPVPNARIPLLQTLPPRCQHPRAGVLHLLQAVNQLGCIATTQSLQFTLRFRLDVVSFIGFDKYTKTCIHNYSILPNNFTAFKIFGAPIYSSLPLSKVLATTGLFAVSIVFPFPECHLVEITKCVVFLDWHLPLSDMHLRFIHVFIYSY